MPEPPHDPDGFLATDPLIDGRIGRSVYGSIVTAGARVAKTFIHFGAIVFLARLVAPDQFGIVALVAAVVAFFELFREMAFASAIGRGARDSDVEISTLFCGGILASMLAVLALVAIAPPLVRIFGREEIVPVCLWLGIAFLISSLSTQHVAILRRQDRFAAMAAIEIGAATAGFLAAIVVALGGAGLWALVAQRLVWAVFLVWASWTICPWRPGLPSLRVGLSGLLGGGARMRFGASAKLAAETLDHLLIGWWAGVHVLGLYERANRGLAGPVRNMSPTLFAVAAPILNRLANHPSRFRNAYLRTFEAICMAAMPLAGVLVAAPDWAVLVLFGERWIEAAPIAMWLGVAALFQPAANAAGWLLAAGQREEDLERWVLIDSAIRLIAVLGAFRFGAEGVAAALALSAFLCRGPLLFWMVGRKGPIGTMKLYAATAPALLAAICAIGVIWSIRYFLGTPFGQPIVGLLIAVGVALAVSVVSFAALPRGRRAWRQLQRLRLALVRAEAMP